MTALQDTGLRALERKFGRVVTLAWWLPVAISSLLQSFLGFWTLEEVVIVLTTLTGAYCIVTNIFAVWLLRRMLRRELLALEDAEARKAPIPAMDGLRRLRTVSFVMFIVYVCIGPVVANLNLVWLEGNVYSASDHLFASLGAVPSALIAAFPIFFWATDLLGRELAPRGVHVMVAPLATRFVVLGLASPVVVDIVLLLYYRDRTGYLEPETVALWLALVVMAALGTWGAYRSLRGSLAPLEAHVTNSAAASGELEAKSLDEIGILTAAWAEMLEQRRLAEESLNRIQKMEALGRLTGGIAHDFNNILTTISASIELAQMRFTPQSRDYEMLSGALEACDNAAKLTQGLMSASGQRPITPEHASVLESVRDSWQVLSSSVGDEVDIALVENEIDCFARIDRAQFASALLNLVMNARDATRPGGSIRVEVRNRVIHDDPVLADGKYVEVMVEDDGDGIAEDVRDKLFEPFFTTKPFGKGNGLGLAAVQAFARQSEGDVRVESALGDGATFAILLPRALMSSTPKSSPKPRGPSNSRAARVLVIDDDDGVRGVVVRQLESDGHHVIELQSAKDLLDQLDEFEAPDVIVSDVVMRGGVSGPELIERLSFRWSSVPVLFISGHTRDYLAQDGRIPEHIAFLEKPFRRDELVSCVRRLLESRVRDVNGA